MTEVQREPISAEGSAGSRSGTSTVTSKLVLDLVEERRGPAGVDRVLRSAELTDQRTALRAPGSRIRYDDKVRLFESAAIELDDPRFGLAVAARAAHDPSFAFLRGVVRASGSTNAALRGVARLATWFDSLGTLRFVESGPTSGTVEWRLLPPSLTTRGECDYVIGLLAQTTVLFGLPPARVEHDRCQVSGHPSCVYALTWEESRPAPARWWKRRADAPAAALGLVGAEERLLALEAAAQDMVRGGSVDEILDRMIARAGSVVHAAGHAIVVRLPDGEVIVRTRGAGDLLRPALGDHGEIDAGHPSIATRAIITAPIASASRSFGSLIAVREEAQDFLPDDRGTLVAYANHAAVGLELSVMLAESNRQRETSELLLGVARSLAAHATVDSVTQRVAEAVPVLTGADRAVIAVWDPDAGLLRVRAMTGVPEPFMAAVAGFSPSPFESPELAALLSVPAPMLIDVNGSEWARENLTVFEVDAVLAMPIAVDGEVRGAILGGWSGGSPATVHPTSLDRLTTLAELAGVALENARLVEVDRWQALHDPLTLLPNRRYFERKFRDAHAVAARTSRPVGVLFCDIDQFKVINDTYGHSVGDAVLASVADRLRAGVREGDLVARLSGDEFVILAPGLADDDELERVASRIRAQLAAPVAVAGGHQVQVRVAIGMATSDSLDQAVAVQEHGLAVPDFSASAESLAASLSAPGDLLPERADDWGDDPVRRILALADQRMYEAKAAATEEDPLAVS